MDIRQRLNEIIAYSGLSVRAFAIKCGITPATLDRQIKGLRGISIETVMGIVSAFPELSTEWLIRGQGDMLLNDTSKLQEEQRSNKEIERINAMLDTITLLQDTIRTKDDTIKMLMKRINELENK